MLNFIIMKIFLLSSFLICSTLSFSQTNDTIEFTEAVKTDTLSSSIKNSAIASTNTKKETAYFIDSVFVHSNILKTLDSQIVKSINVVKKDTIINKKAYSGKIYITTKNPIQHNFLTLEQIKTSFTDYTAPTTIYILDNKLITDAIETYNIDRNYILKVDGKNTNYFESLKDNNLNIDIITILTKTKENIEREKTKIILKGMKK